VTKDPRVIAAQPQAAHRYAVFETALGFCAIAWNEAGITRFQLPARTAGAAERTLLGRLPGAAPHTPPPRVAETIEAARRYFLGERMDFADCAVHLEQDELFTRIYAAARRIGWGAATTYGTLAKELQLGPEGARDVGRAMAQNPVPLIIPCHRVLAAGGKLGGFSAPGGTATKIRMLAIEGIRAEPPAQQSLAL
jgi:methylated-DNA-[protein]-cysteine S-methyltransferase